MKALLSILLIASLPIIAPITASAHGGGLDKKGGHYNRKTGVYHCHRCVSPRASQKSSSQFAPSAAAQTLPTGANRTQVRTAQNLLIVLGYDIGTSDGVYGQKTRMAVTKFQINYGLQPDGEIGDVLISHLTDAVTAKSATGS